MPWIESHQKLERHPKLLELCSKTGWSKDEIIGKLHRLWWWVLDYAEDGILDKFSPDQCVGNILSNSSKLSTASELYNILKLTKFIDENDKIHDWWDYAGNYLYAKYHNSNPNKLKKIRKMYQGNQRITKGYTKETIPTLTNQPTLTNHIVAQFPKDIQNLTGEYIEIAEKENKTGKILETKRARLINELHNFYTQAEPKKFIQALEITVKNQAPNINYVKKVYKNIEKKIQVGLQTKGEKEKKEFEDGSRRGQQAVRKTQEYIKQFK